MNMLSYWFFFASCLIMTISLFVQSGPAGAGWTIYPPLSAVPQAMSGSGLGMTLWLISMALFIVPFFLNEEFMKIISKVVALMAVFAFVGCAGQAGGGSTAGKDCGPCSRRGRGLLG